MFIKKIKNFCKYSILFLLIILANNARAEFFEDLSKIIENNEKRLSYGISVTDFNMDGNNEFLVTGFGFPNLALSFQDGKLKNINQQKIFSDISKKTIGVAACDIDKDGFEEIYFLNTDTYSGVKKYSDRLLDIKDNNYFDLFELEKNKENLNLTAGRSVVCVDRKGDGEYGIYVANYGGPTRFYEIENELIKDKAENLNLDNITGGRAVVSGHILTERADIFAANERGANFLFKNNNGNFDDVAFDYRVDDAIQNGRGTALSDIYYDGFDEVFMNNIAEPNKLFRIKDNGKFEQINFQVGLEANGYGTGAAVADIDDDGILELLVSRGESKAQTLTLYKAKVDKGSKYLRIKPLNKYGAPARGATVTLITNQRKHSKTIDAGSGYLCQMEPVAHYGIRKKEKNFKVEIRWTNGSKEMIDIKKLNQTIIVRQK